MTTVFYSERRFYIFYWEHAVAVAMNLNQPGMFPVILPVNGFMYGPVCIADVYFFSVFRSDHSFFIRTCSQHPVLNGFSKFGGSQRDELVKPEFSSNLHP